MMNALSPWAVSASAELAGSASVLYERLADSFSFTVIATTDSIWIQLELPSPGRVAFRAAYSPGNDLEVVESKDTHQQGIMLKLNSAIRIQNITISIDQTEKSPVLRYTTSLTPAKEMIMPSWPKDILFNGKNNNPEQTQ